MSYEMIHFSVRVLGIDEHIGETMSGSSTHVILERSNLLFLVSVKLSFLGLDLPMTVSNFSFDYIPFVGTIFWTNLPFVIGFYGTTYYF